jgi:hypothetical protein
MEITLGVGAGYRVLLHRSDDNGTSWETVDSLEMDDGYIAVGDPVMAIDVDGNPYLLNMELLEGSNLNIHLRLYKSVDEGQTWEVLSKPYVGGKFSDTPHFWIDASNTFYISYSEYDNASVFPSFVHFIRSEDGGLSWTDPKIFEATQSGDIVGSYFSLSEGNQINLAFGDYSKPKTYFTSSSDAGESWDALIEFNNTIPFGVTKVLANESLENICVLSHRAHDPTSGIYLNYSLDNGDTWAGYKLADNASMAEGFIDNDGFIHLTFHQFDGNEFSVNYMYSIDGGVTFSNPVELYGGPSFIAFPLPQYIMSTSGESQSLRLGKDQLFHLTFVDWTDFTQAKHLIFEPFNFVSSDEQMQVDQLFTMNLYPNPAVDYLTIRTSLSNESSYWSIKSMAGKTIRDGHVDLEEEFSINIQNLPSGNYLFSMRSESYIVVRKFVKI